MVSVDIAGSKLKSVLLRDGSKIMCRGRDTYMRYFFKWLNSCGSKKNTAGRMGKAPLRESPNPLNRTVLNQEDSRQAPHRALRRHQSDGKTCQ